MLRWWKAAWSAPATVWVLLLGWLAFWTWQRWSPGGVSWHYFPSGARYLLHTDGLHLYAHHPELQIGPLTFLVVAPLTALSAKAGLVVAKLVMAAVLPVIIVLLVPLVPGPRRRLRVLLAGLVLTPSWTVLAVRWCHPDDVLALLLTACAVRAVAGRRAVWAGLALGGAIAAKPWAIGFVPILLPLAMPGVLLGLAAVAVAAGLLWGPFLLADPNTLQALRPPVGVNDSSGLRALGYRGTVVPPWDRTAQLVAAPLAGLAAVLLRRWPGALLSAIAVRLALDPQDIDYYVAGAVLAAVVFDLMVTSWTVPWTAVVTAVVLWQPFAATNWATRMTTSHGLSLWWFRHPFAVGLIHLGWSAAMVVLVLLVPARLLGSPGRPGAAQPVGSPQPVTDGVRTRGTPNP